MQIIRSPADAATITNLELRTCIEKTISDLSEDYPYDPDVLGYFLVVEIHSLVSTSWKTNGQASALTNPAICNRLFDPAVPNPDLPPAKDDRYGLAA